MLNEHEAWLWLTVLWDESDDGTVRGGLGICATIKGLEAEGEISTATADAMLLKIHTHAPCTFIGVGVDYRWPLGDTASRAAFCRAMASLTQSPASVPSSEPPDPRAAAGECS